MTQINKDKGIRNRIKYPKSVYQIKRILWLKIFKMNRTDTFSGTYSRPIKVYFSFSIIK